MPRPSKFVKGSVHGRLTAWGETVPGKALYRCACGRFKEAQINHVQRNLTTSCGCFHAEQASKSLKARNTKHGMYGTRAYTTWQGMLSRCTNEHTKSFASYGGRGITVAPEWRAFDAFYADMGAPPAGMSLDRIDNNSGYSKSNCRWASTTEQSLNKRSNVQLTHNGKTQTATEWAKQLNIPRQIIYSRKREGWSDEKTLTSLIKKK